jgi:hypothetical protein
MLAIVSALVAFRAWPGDSGEAAAAVPVEPGGGDRVALKQVRTAPAPRTAAFRRLAAPARDRAAATPRPTTTGLVKVTVINDSPSGVVKVPPGVRMTVPPAQTPTAQAPPQPPLPVDTGERPAPGGGGGSPLLPEPSLPPPGTGTDAVEDTLAGIVEPLPGDHAGAVPSVTIAPEQGAILDVSVGSTTIRVGLP